MEKRRMSSKPLKIFCLIALLGFSMMVLPFTAAESESLWQMSSAINSLSFDAQSQLMAMRRADDPQPFLTAAADDITQIEEVYLAGFQTDILRVNPAHDALILTALDDAQNAIAGQNEAALASARGRLWTRILAGTYDVVLDALSDGDTQTASDWLRVREFRQATRVSVVEDNATRAITAYAAGEIDLTTARDDVAEDLRDAYFFRFREALNELEIASERDFATRAAEWSGLAAGYFAILQEDFRSKQGQAAMVVTQNHLTALEDATLRADWQQVGAIIPEVRASINEYTPIEYSDAELSARGRTLHNFIGLIDIEYQNAVRDGHITTPIEYQEATTFHQQARAIYEEIRPALLQKNSVDAARLAVILDEIDAVMTNIGQPSEVETLVAEGLYIVESNLDTQAVASDAAAAFVHLDDLLNDLERAVRQGRYGDAEQLRIEAYAVFDTGPELRLAAIDPALMGRIEGLFWQGDGDQMGLAQGIARRAAHEDVVTTRAALSDALALAQVKLTSGSSAPMAIIINTALIVFREGLEAVVILAALMASMASKKQKGYRKPIAVGAGAAFFASALTFIVATFFLKSLSQHGEKLEAIVSLVAIAVLLLITNWFFHKAYWTNWMARFHRAKSDTINSGDRRAQFWGLLLIGFTSIYREGFETVLFLQALVLDAGMWVVLQGVALGLIFVFGVGYLTFKLQTRLPYKKLLIVTGILIVSVLFTLVGHTIHLFQAVGWMPITPLNDVIMPYWVGLWLGIYPTLQTLIGQFFAVAFVVGSYALAEVFRSRTRIRGRKRRTARTVQSVM
jgi:high-affinity iron transporter